MASKAHWKKLSFDFLSELRKIKTQIDVEVGGRFFVALPEVFSPVCSSDTKWFAEKIASRVSNLSFLEIGAGTGIIACLAKLHGAEEVVATDISSKAIENILLNQKRLNLNFSVRIGDVFQPIRENELFDIIFWNHPFNYSDDKECGKDILNLSVFDYEYESLSKFFREGKKHLKKDGKLLLGTSNIAKLRLIKQMAKNEGYEISLLEKTNVAAYQTRKMQMDLRLYSFKKTDLSDIDLLLSHK